MAEGITLATGEDLDLPIPKPAEPDSAPSSMDPPRREPKDPEAPYGRKLNGEPKKAAGGRPAKEDRPRVTTAPSGGTTAPAEKVKGWTEGLTGIGQLIAGGCLMGYQATGSKALAADAVAVSRSAPVLSAAVADLGATDPRIGKILDKICTVGPYGALITAVVGLGAQIAVNHGAIQPGLMGTAAADDLIASASGDKADDGSVPES